MILSANISDKEWIKFQLNGFKGNSKERVDFLETEKYIGVSLTDDSDKTINRLLIVNQ